MGIFSRKPSAGQVSSTKAGRAFADAQKELDRNRKNDRLAQQRAKKQGKS